MINTTYPFLNLLSPTPDKFDNGGWHTTFLITTVVISCSFSILGSMFIVASYGIWRNIRSNLRLLLVFLSICDGITAAGNLVGTFFRGPDHTGCVIQSFITTTSSLMSFMWTISIAIYLYLTLSKRLKTAKRSMTFFQIFCWGVPLIITTIAVSVSALGRDSFSALVGWCWIGDPIWPPFDDMKHRQLFWKIVAGKGVEITSYFVTPVIYILSKRSLKYEKHVHKHILTNAHLEVLEEADRKLMMVPIIFVFGRIWGTIRWIMSEVDSNNQYIFALAVFQAIGDSSQGWANCVIFCFFNRILQYNLARTCRSLFGDCCSRKSGYSQVE